MKKLISIILVMIISLGSYAQDVTKFLGIPVDGTKESMKQKLIQKGFKYNVKEDILEGEFNGGKVDISIVTYRNKVWRIAVMDANPCDESQIKIRFNNLCNQFARNKKYMPMGDADKYIIPDDEDISYELSVNNKSYEASYIQNIHDIDSIQAANLMKEALVQKFSVDDMKSIENLSESEILNIAAEALYEYCRKKTVWFTIRKDYLGYNIIIFYDNELNHNTDDEI